MKQNYLKPSELIIPITLVAFLCSGVTFLDGIFNTTTRWFFLAVLILFLVSYCWSSVICILYHPLFKIVLIYAFWIFLSIAWSLVPQISFYKSCIFVCMSMFMMSAGYSWIIRHNYRQSCDFLWPIVIISLYSSLMGINSEKITTISEYYQGLVSGSNHLGFLLAISSCWLVWRIYLARFKHNYIFVLYIILFSVTLYYLFLSHSRSSLLIFIATVLSMFLALNRVEKWLWYISFFFMLCATIYNFSPSLNYQINQYIFKPGVGRGVVRGDGMVILQSREEVWKESYNKAIDGGMFGAGNGVFIDYDFSGKIGPSLSTGEYGREQGNSQYAIIEQIGFVGFFLYLILISGIIGVIFFGLRNAQFKIDRAVIGLFGGVILGLLGQSVFEAWWVAQSSPESATFWMFLGALLAAIRRSKFASMNQNLSIDTQKNH